MDIKSLLATTKPALEFMYDSLLTVKRNESYVKPNGADGQRYVTVIEAVPCRFSKSESDLSNTSTVQEANMIDYKLKIFTSSSHDIKAGDELFRDGVRIGYAKEPYAYTNHQELFVEIEGEA